MQLAKIGARGRTTIPKPIQKATGLHEGDAIAFEIEGDRLVVVDDVPGRGVGLARAPYQPVPWNQEKSRGTTSRGSSMRTS